VVIGERLWQGKARTIINVVKSVSKEGADLEYTWEAQLKGAGKAKGFDGALTFTGNTTINSTGGGTTVGSGIFTTAAGDIVVIKGCGYAKPEAGRGRSIAIWRFIAMSEALHWMDSIVGIMTQDGDAGWQEFDVVIYEWA
jgi:hypothetical protein